MSINNSCGFGRFLFATVAVAVFAASPGLSRAAVISGSSDGYGLSVDVNALNVVNLDVGPLPVGVGGTAPAPYADSDTVLNVSVSDSVPLVVSGNVAADSVFASASSDVDGALGPKMAMASSGVVNLGIDTVTLPVLGPGITLLGLDGTLTSSAQVTGDFGAFAAMGMTTIESLDLTISAIPVDLSAFVNVMIAPNTTVDLGALGIANATLILNEQIIAGDQSSITVNALRLSVNVANSIVADVVVGHSFASLTGSAIPEPASGLTALAAIAVCGATLRRCRPSEE